VSTHAYRAKLTKIAPPGEQIVVRVDGPQMRVWVVCAKEKQTTIG
jgi:hypothetical protein